MKRKVKGGWRVYSHRTGKNLGTYKTKGEADRAIRRHKSHGKRGKA